MSDIEDEQIDEKLQELQNYQVIRTGLLVAEEYLAISTRVQELQNGLFQRQHRDIQKLNESVKDLTNSSHRVEKLTRWLIAITIALGLLTALDVLKFLWSN
jgi:hypothetical protein